MIDTLIGQTAVAVAANDDRMVIKTDDRIYTFYHQQDCCESVWIEDIAGNLDDLVGSPFTMAEVSTEDTDADPDDWDNSCQMWTFYRFATVKGYVTVRWFGASNGYYSVGVSLHVTDHSGKTIGRAYG